MYLSDVLTYTGRTTAFRRLLTSLDGYDVGDGADDGFDFIERRIWAGRLAGLARMRRVVALCVRIDGDVRGGFENLASDEHLCVTCTPDAWIRVRADPRPARGARRSCVPWGWRCRGNWSTTVPAN